jgi:pimeloyl-ACP methyl ester carboxylesterase
VAAERIETALGPVEIARAGSGEPVLVVHGTPGGCDAGLVMGRFLVEAGFEVIAASRPGYLGTPLQPNAAPESQADLLAALLDALGIERAGLLIWSGGGPAGYGLAARHPDRVSALVAMAAVSIPIDDNVPLEERVFARTRLGNRLLRFLIRVAPKSTVKATIKTEGNLKRSEIRLLTERTLADPDMYAVVIELARVVADYPPRRDGVRNDWHWFANVGDLGFESITAPCLLIHGDCDAEVPPAHSAHVQDRVPDCETLVVERGTHIALWINRELRSLQGRAIGHLRR